jgi:hypothetical protein
LIFRHKGLFWSIAFCVFEIALTCRDIWRRQLQEFDIILFLGEAWILAVLGICAVRSRTTRDCLIFATATVIVFVFVLRPFLSAEWIIASRYFTLALWVVLAIGQVVLFWRDHLTTHQSQITN